MYLLFLIQFVLLAVCAVQVSSFHQSKGLLIKKVELLRRDHSYHRKKHHEKHKNQHPKMKHSIYMQFQKRGYEQTLQYIKAAVESYKKEKDDSLFNSFKSNVPNESLSLDRSIIPVKPKPAPNRFSQAFTAAKKAEGAQLSSKKNLMPMRAAPPVFVKPTNQQPVQQQLVQKQQQPTILSNVNKAAAATVASTRQSTPIAPVAPSESVPPKSTSSVIPVEQVPPPPEPIYSPPPYTDNVTTLSQTAQIPSAQQQEINQAYPSLSTIDIAPTMQEVVIETPTSFPQSLFQQEGEITNLPINYLQEMPTQQDLSSLSQNPSIQLQDLSLNQPNFQNISLPQQQSFPYQQENSLDQQQELVNQVFQNESLQQGVPTEQDVSIPLIVIPENFTIKQPTEIQLLQLPDDIKNMSTLI